MSNNNLHALTFVAFTVTLSRWVALSSPRWIVDSEKFNSYSGLWKHCEAGSCSSYLRDNKTIPLFPLVTCLINFLVSASVFYYLICECWPGIRDGGNLPPDHSRTIRRYCSRRLVICAFLDVMTILGMGNFHPYNNGYFGSSFYFILCPCLLSILAAIWTTVLWFVVEDNQHTD